MNDATNKPAKIDPTIGKPEETRKEREADIREDILCDLQQEHNEEEPVE